VPATRRDFWQAKFARNKTRDARDLARAEAGGCSTSSSDEASKLSSAHMRARSLAWIFRARLTS
jgi:G:T-mismatch repair DNA endonuclease (very short patch repair protein)